MKWHLHLVGDDPVMISISNKKRTKFFLWDDKHLNWIDVTPSRRMLKCLEEARR